MKVVLALAVSFGQAVRNRRQTLGLSQEELAWRGGLNRSYVTDIERGARNPSLRTIGRLAEALQMPLYALLREAEEQLPERSRDRATRVKGAPPP
jgi:transcriptional regulator with XRE-family HTH domain